MRRHVLPLVLSCLTVAALGGCEIVRGLVRGLVRGQVSLPSRVEATPERIATLKLPAGFRLNVYARDLGNVRNMAFDATGAMYATRRKEGEVIRLADTNGDGQADETRVVASGIQQVNGLAIRQGAIYLAPPTQVLTGPIAEGGAIGPLTPLVSGLPEGKQHPNRTLAFGPDGMLYLTIGSSCNDCDEPDPRYATIMRMNPDGTDPQIFARGLRNTIGFDWHPFTGDLWGMDHGSDWRGPDQPPEELNRLVKGGHYGWPFCWGAQFVDAQTEHAPEGMSREAFCVETVAPAMTYQAHSAPLDLVFYEGAQFPEGYTHDAFVSFHGSWNRNPPTGYKVVRVHYEAGWPVRWEDFLTGFLSEDRETQFGRPAGLAVGPEGALYVADDANGVIYRVTYAGD